MISKSGKVKWCVNAPPEPISSSRNVRPVTALKQGRQSDSKSGDENGTLIYPQNSYILGSNCSSFPTNENQPWPGDTSCRVEREVLSPWPIQSLFCLWGLPMRKPVSINGDYGRSSFCNVDTMTCPLGTYPRPTHSFHTGHGTAM